MSLPRKIVLITGANAGIGKELARLLALDNAVGLIYLTCRSEAKAAAAIRELAAVTGAPSSKFKSVVMDLCDLDSVRRAVGALADPVDLLYMNAGGPLDASALTLTRDGVTVTFASNILGHVVLLEGLIDAHKLTGCAVLAGAESVRGVPMLGVAAPKFVSSSVAEFASIIDSSDFRQRPVDIMMAYSQVKYIGAMYMAAMARRHPTLRFLTVSPGNTKGTDAANGLPWFLRFMIRYVANPIILPLLGQVHSLAVGTRRLIDAVSDPTIPSGSFYASKKGVSGPIADQAIFNPEFKSEASQDHAYEAIHRFIHRPPSRTGSAGPNTLSHKN